MKVWTKNAVKSKVDPVTPHGLVELKDLEPSLKLDIRYATAANFIGRPVYSTARAFLLSHVAEALVRAHLEVRSHGLGLLIFDGYRPWSVTKIFWDETVPEKRIFVADPAKGSVHNRGCAVDLGLFELATGLEVPMPSEFDEMTERSFMVYEGGSTRSRQVRDLLKRVMESHGFLGIPHEWWHFNFPDWKKFPILDLDFSQL